MSQPIRLGFIGASASNSSSSWAAQTHIPYLTSPRNNNLYTIRAIQNSSKASAQNAVQSFSLPGEVACHDNPTSLAGDPTIDVVAVSVNVPKHLDAVMPALHAGRDVFVEWPLARNLADAETMAQLAREKNVMTMVGLQARHSPSVLAAKRLVADGTIGEVVGTTMKGYGLIFGAQTWAATAYLFPVENGANLLTISFGHAVDALCFVLGELEYVQATLANRRPEFETIDGAGNVVGKATKTAHDFISVAGTLVEGGGVVNVVYQGGFNPMGPGFVWQIDGTKGSILLEGDMGHVQMWQPKVKMILNGEKEMREVDGIEWVGDDFSYAVGRAWDAFARLKRGEDVETGSVATFDDALVRHRMIDAVYRSNEKGTREKYI